MNTPDVKANNQTDFWLVTLVNIKNAIREIIPLITFEINAGTYPKPNFLKTIKAPISCGISWNKIASPVEIPKLGDCEKLTAKASPSVILCKISPKNATQPLDSMPFKR